MKREFCFFMLALLLLAGCSGDAGFTFKNPLPVDRPDEVVVISRTDFAQKFPEKVALQPVFKNSKGELIPSQLDDLDADGTWDEAVLLLDFKADESVAVSVDFVPQNEYPDFEKRTNLRLGIIQDDGSYKEVDYYEALPCTEEFRVISQGEGVNWENDRIGFRNYFDCRNVKDLFGKLKPELIIDKIQTPGMGSYHDLADWGMDVLHCGSSLGSGGLALLRNDSLFRLGSTQKYEYQKIVEGPVRSVFELRYDGWQVENELLSAIERISIYPGKYWFQSEVTVQGCQAGDQIVTGIVTSHLKREPFAFQAAGFQCIGTHDVQSLNNDELGMAVIVPQPEAGKIARTTDINFFKLGYETVKSKGFSHIISETYYIGQHCTNAKPATHYFFSVWGLDKDQWKTEEGFKKYISEEAEKLSSAIEMH